MLARALLLRVLSLTPGAFRSSIGAAIGGALLFALAAVGAPALFPAGGRDGLENLAALMLLSWAAWALGVSTGLMLSLRRRSVTEALQCLVLGVGSSLVSLSAVVALFAFLPDPPLSLPVLAVIQVLAIGVVADRWIAGVRPGVTSSQEE